MMKEVLQRAYNSGLSWAQNIARCSYNIYGHFYGAILLPTRYGGGKAFRQYYQELQKTQWWSREQLEELQMKKLQAILKHAYENVPYYQRVFKARGLKPEDIKDFHDLEKLPILEKEDVRDNFKDLIARNVREQNLTLRHTGGTTGTPTHFYYDLGATTAMYAIFERWRNWAGVRFTDKHILMLGYVLQSTTTGKPMLWNYNSWIKRLRFSASNLTPEVLGEYIRKIRQFKPVYIQGYPSAFYLLALYAKEQRIDDIRLKAVLTSSETLFEYQRKIIEEAFNCNVLDLYDSNEGVASAIECPTYKGCYHINMERGIVEIVDKEGEQVSTGELGEIIGTGLDNYAMPLIRYRLGDVSKMLGENCPCGRGLSLLGHIEGRADDFIVTPEGRIISPPGMTIPCRQIDSVKEYQFIQKTRDKLIVKIVRRENYSDEDTKKFLSELRKYVGDSIRIELEFVDSIPRTKSGKYRFVISKVPIEYKVKG